MAKARPRATYADLLKLPDHVVGELIDGELHVTPRPAVPHAAVTAALAGELVGPFQRGRGGPGGWWLFIEPEIHLGERVVVPDLAGWRHERMPRRPHTAAIELRPDWVCEVISPATGAQDRARKMPLYAEVGVAHAWLVDPVMQTLEVYRLDGAGWRLVATHARDALVRAEPFDDLEVELAAWWLEPAGE